jgi:hypothetical protein
MKLYQFTFYINDEDDDNKGYPFLEKKKCSFCLVTLKNCQFRNVSSNPTKLLLK